MSNATQINFVNRNGKKSKVTLRKYLAIFERMTNGHECEHGHEGCSAFNGGPCVDDINGGRYDDQEHEAA